MNDPDFNLLAALDPLPVSTEVITVSQAWHPRLEQAPATAGCGSGCVIFDIDNTLVPHGAPATKEAAAFFASLRETGFSTFQINNSQTRNAEFGQKKSALI